MENYIKNMTSWANKHLLQLFVFNLIAIVLVLLKTAGYFAPYFPLTVNFIFLVIMLSGTLLFKFTSKVVFLIALLFWIFAAAIRILGVDIWAERTAIYTYQSLVIGVLLFILETLRKDNRK